jgi:hypothetical protein
MYQHLRRPFLLLVALILVAAAVPPLALAQTYALEVYTNPNFGGSLCISNAPESANIHTSCNDQISSIRLKAGWSVRVFSNQGQGGSSVCFNRGDPDLADNTFEDGLAVNDTISSFSLYNQAWCGGAPTPAYPLEVYNDADYGGTQCYSWQSETANIYASCDDQISSALLRSGWSMRVYSQQNQGGSRGCLTASDSNLADNTFFDGSSMNDAISSFVLYSQANCPNTAPNIPSLIGPANGSVLTNRAVTLSWSDPGDPDNWPRPYRDYYAEIRKSDNSWSTMRPWQTDTSWNLTVPSDGTYVWRVRSGDGQLGSGWSSEWSFTVGTGDPPPSGKTLNVPYVDQVYVQRDGIPVGGGYYLWNDCGPASVAMILSYEGKETRDVFNDRQPTLELRSQVKRPGEGAANWGLMENTFRSKGLQVERRWAPSFAAIKQSIQNGHPILMGIGQANHLLVVVGVDGTDTVIVNDPYGGKDWWKNGQQTNFYRAGQGYITPSTSPQQKGKGIAYRYGTELTAQNTLFINGPAPAPRATIAQIGASGGILAGEGTRISFPPAATISAQADASELTITHTLQFAPNQPTDGLGHVLSAFSIVASDANGLPIQQFSRLFTLTVDLDPTLIEGLYFEGGSTNTSANSGGSTSTAIPKPASGWKLSLAYWSSSSEHWILLPSHIDSAHTQLVAVTNQFREYAVFVQPEWRIQVPLVQR